MISLHNISKRYHHLVLENLNIEFDKKINFIVGQNGEGKTTLINILLGIVKPTSGYFTIDGVPIKYSNGRYRKNIGISINIPTYPFHYKVNEFITLLYQIYEIYRDVDYENELIDFFDLRKYLNYKISDLSTGFIQRVKLFSSMLHKPNIYIYDEPFISLDDEFVEKFVLKIKSLQQQDCYFIISSHNTKTINLFDEYNKYKIENKNIKKIN